MRAVVDRLLAIVALPLLVAACLPAPASTQAREIADLYAVFVAGGIVVAVIVWGLATWVVVRYRRRGDELPEQTHGNMRIEAVWTAIPLVTVLVLFVLTVRTLGAVDALGDAGVEVRVTAFRWQWQVDYPGSGVRLVGTTDQPLEVVLPVDTPIHVTLESLDVNHALYVPAFLFKRDAIPGKPTLFELQVTEPGVYPGACAEFCGIGHDQMPFTIRGVDAHTFEAWLADHASGASPTGQGGAPASPTP